MISIDQFVKELRYLSTYQRAGRYADLAEQYGEGFARHVREAVDLAERRKAGAR